MSCADWVSLDFVRTQIETFRSSAAATLWNRLPDKVHQAKDVAFLLLRQLKSHLLSTLSFPMSSFTYPHSIKRIKRSGLACYTLNAKTAVVTGKHAYLSCLHTHQPSVRLRLGYLATFWCTMLIQWYPPTHTHTQHAHTHTHIHTSHTHVCTHTHSHTHTHTHTHHTPHTHTLTHILLPAAETTLTFNPLLPHVFFHLSTQY